MTKRNYSGYRFLPDIIQQAIWLYLRQSNRRRIGDDCQR